MIERGLKSFLRTAFDIRPGELSRALLMQLNIFLIILTLLIIKPTVNGLFLSRFGADGLPLAYILVALFAILVTTLYARLMSRLPLLNMILGNFAVNIIVLAGFGFLLNQQILPGWELYLLYIWVAVFGVFSASQFWIMANILFNAREAKRLFGFIGAGAIIGGISGGYLTNYLAPRLGSENLFYLSACLLALCMPITYFVWKRYIKGAHHNPEEKRQLARHVGSPVFQILKSKHLTFLAAIVGLSVIVAKLADFQYSDIAARRIPDKDELTAFFGFWFSNFSILSLLFQLFLTRRVLARLGISGALMALPAGIFLGALAVLFFPVLWAAVLIKAADGSLKQSVNKSAIELLGIPIPLEIKKRTKTFIDVVVDSIATGLGGIILIFLVHGFNLSTQSISLFIIALILAWGYFIVRVRKDYLESFRVNILKLRKNRKNLNLSSGTLMRDLARLLEKGSDAEKVWALKQVQDLEAEQFYAPALTLLDDPSPAIRAGALRTLDNYHHHDLSQKVWPLTKDPDLEVQVAAYNYLVSHGKEEIPKVRDLVMADEMDYRVSGPVLISIGRETSHNPRLRQMLGVKEFIIDQSKKIKLLEDPARLLFWKKTLAKGIGEALIPETYFILEELMEDPDPGVREEALLAAGHTNDPRFIRVLAQRLAHPDTRKVAIQALVSYGPAVLVHLQEINEEPGVDIRVVRFSTEVAERLETQESVEFLFNLSDHPDQGVQIEALRSLTDLKRNYPQVSFNSKVLLQRILEEAELYENTLTTLYAQVASQNIPLKTKKEKNIREAREGLIHLLERRLDNHFERIFRLLGLRYTPDDFFMFMKFKHHGAKSHDVQANAIEFLENLLEPGLKKVVVPIVESSLTETITQDILEKFDIDIPKEEECFRMLLGIQDVRIRLAIFYLIEQIDSPKYLPLIEPFLNSNDHKVRDYASRVHSRITAGPDAST